MYGYLQSDPTKVVLLEPIVPLSGLWWGGCRFCARWVDEVEHHLYVAPHEVYGIIPVEDVSNGVI